MHSIPLLLIPLYPQRLHHHAVEFVLLHHAAHAVVTSRESLFLANHIGVEEVGGAL